MNPLNEESAVRNLGDAIGYGRLMQLAEEIWRKKAQPSGTELTVGPCGMMLVPCPHPDVAADLEKHCSWCCGAGRVTQRVADVMSG